MKDFFGILKKRLSAVFEFFIELKFELLLNQMKIKFHLFQKQFEFELRIIRYFDFRINLNLYQFERSSNLNFIRKSKIRN